MPSFTKAIIAGVAYALAVAGSARADECTDGPIDQLKTWGKLHEDADGFCDTAWKGGKVITGIEVWANKHHIKGIQLTYSDGTKPPVEGTPAGDRYDAINWRPEDTIQVMKLAENKKGDGIGLIYVEVGDQKLDVRSGSVGEDDEEEVNEASGILIGASGQARGFIHQWTPLFLGVTQGDARIVDLQFDNDLEEINRRQEGIQAVSLHDVWIKNTSPAGSNGTAQAWNFQGSRTMTKSSSFSSTKQSTFGVTTSVEVGGKVGIPFLTEGQVTFGLGTSYEYQSATMDLEEESNTQTVSWLQGSTPTSDLIQPGFAKHCNASAYQGTYEGGYTSVVEITVGGKEFTYEQRGDFISISHTGAFSECKTVAIADIPTDANIVDAPETGGSVPRTSSSTPETESRKRAVKFSS